MSGVRCTGAKGGARAHTGFIADGGVVFGRRTGFPYGMSRARSARSAVRRNEAKPNDGVQCRAAASAD